MRINLELLKTKLFNLLSHDFFSVFDRERQSHISFNKYLEKRYPKPEGLVKVGTYYLPEYAEHILLERPYIISGGCEFHIEFECELSRLFPQVKIDIFEVDIRSVEWFRENYASKKNLQIFHRGLSDFPGKTSVFGSPKKGWSSCIEDSHIENSPLPWEKVCDADLVTVGQHLSEIGISPQGVGILKLDIEGMADRVIKNSLDEGIAPRIILFEMERAQKMPFATYRERVIQLLRLVRKAKYNVYFLPRQDRYTSFSSEFLLLANS